MAHVFKRGGSDLVPEGSNENGEREPREGVCDVGVRVPL